MRHGLLIFKAKGFYVVKLDARRRNSMKEIQNVILEACKEKIERDRRRGNQKPPGSCHGCGNTRTWENLHLSIPLPEKHVQRPEINQV